MARGAASVPGTQINGQHHHQPCHGLLGTAVHDGVNLNHFIFGVQVTSPRMQAKSTTDHWAGKQISSDLAPNSSCCLRNIKFIQQLPTRHQRHFHLEVGNRVFGVNLGLYLGHNLSEHPGWCVSTRNFQSQCNPVDNDAAWKIPSHHCSRKGCCRSLHSSLTFMHL